MTSPVSQLDEATTVGDDDLLYLVTIPLAEQKKVRAQLLRQPALRQRKLQLSIGASHARINIWAFGSVADLDELTAQHIGGHTLELQNLQSLLLQSVMVDYDAGFNPGNTWSFRYPAPFAATALSDMMFPELLHWNTTNPAVLQPLTLTNCLIDNGVIQIQKTGLQAGVPARWKLRVL